MPEVSEDSVHEVVREGEPKTFDGVEAAEDQQAGDLGGEIHHIASLQGISSD